MIEGAPASTYLFFSTMDSLKTMDDFPARQKALTEAMGADNYHQLMKGSGDTFALIESNLFAASPRMSYVAKATADEDPEFWKPKVSAKPEAAAKPKEKGGQ